MKRVMLIAGLVMAATPANLLAQGQPAAKPAGPVRTITITATDSPMKWDLVKIAAKPGEQIKVVLKATGTMPKVAVAHNFVLLKRGLEEKDVTAFVNEAITSAATAYIPPAKKDWVLAYTAKVAGAGETVEVTFTAPTATGAYPYLCSFPGHHVMGMKGVLTVAR